MVAGVLSLAIYQEVYKYTHSSVPSFEDLKIATAPSLSASGRTALSTPLRSNFAPSQAAKKTEATLPSQHYAGQWTTSANVSTPRLRANNSGVGVVRPPVQPVVQDTPVPPRVIATATPSPKGQEVSIFLDRPQQINTAARSYRIFVHDHGSETISVSVGYGGSTRVKKAFGSDVVGDNKALIYSDSDVRLYHLNTPRAPQNCCLIEVMAAK